jgi:hypothetical protein
MLMIENRLQDSPMFGGRQSASSVRRGFPPSRVEPRQTSFQGVRRVDPEAPLCMSVGPNDSARAGPLWAIVVERKQGYLVALSWRCGELVAAKSQRNESEHHPASSLARAGVDERARTYPRLYKDSHTALIR